MREIDFDRLNQRLLLAGVAPKYVRRTISELRNHLEDLVRQELTMGHTELEAKENAYALLGDENQIVNEAIAKPEIKTWSRRFTKSVFLATPTIVYIAAVLGITIAYVLPAFALFGFDVNDPWPTWYFWIARITAWFSEYLLTPMIAFFFCMLAIRRGVHLLWPMTGIGIVVFFGSGWETLVEIPIDARSVGISLSWGYAFIPWRPVQMEWGQTLEQLVRIGVTMGMIYALPRFYQPYELEAE